jgi:hypothetical protein
MLSGLCRQQYCIFAVDHGIVCRVEGASISWQLLVCKAFEETRELVVARSVGYT